MSRPNFQQTKQSGGMRQPNAAAQVRLASIAENFRAAYAIGDFQSGAKFAEEALQITPGNMSILPDYALCLMRTNAFDQAYRVYMSIHNAPASQRKLASSTWLDGLVEVCGWLGKTEEMREYGLRSLRASDAKCGANSSEPIPDHAPQPFNAANPAENVIAYSLFGSNPRYCEPAVMNAQMTRDVFKGWTCRVYLDASVPEHVQRRLKEAGAEVVFMEPDANVHPLMWRFLVIDDSSVKRFLLRDADALLSEREYAAVQEWVESPYYFHVIRDYFTHTELILAGLWGGCAGVLHNAVASMQQFAAKNADSGRFVDQHYLREHVWSTLRKSVLSHDDIFGFHDAKPFPPHAPNRWNTDKFHVGSNTSVQAIGGESELPDGDSQRLIFSSAEGKVLFDYEVIVKNGQWRLDMPFFVIEKLKSGEIVVQREQ
ncbi:tetratricopeptide repeat protein [Caballeronia sp. SBC2]|uniref:tetratricopeptide repeat protein n=1 Tax=Caballeronia sp. SBC2 TaxID=2705547 RepID=UPI0019D07A10|nr:tetratricopeptide repeat protein [Caballeronia sp. SBC2]